jgi:PAS domain S-box-containing protein
MSVTETSAEIETARPSEPAPSVEHLRRLIEKLPCCVVRVSIEGVLLAANDAALGLLGAGDACQVLGRGLTGWIAPEHHPLWSAFAGDVASGASRSLECDLTDLSGARRTVLLHGVPLLDHPDGTLSMMLGARDISTLRQLEGSQEQLERLLRDGRTHLEAQRAQLVGAAAEGQRLEALLEER